MRYADHRNVLGIIPSFREMKVALVSKAPPDSDKHFQLHLTDRLKVPSSMRYEVRDTTTVMYEHLDRIHDKHSLAVMSVIMPSDLDREPPHGEECMPHLFLGILYGYAVERGILLGMIDYQDTKLALRVKPRGSEADMYESVIRQFGDGEYRFTTAPAVGAALGMYQKKRWKFEPNLFAY